jgi:hypothetical protein
MNRTVYRQKYLITMKKENNPQPAYGGVADEQGGKYLVMG